MPYDKLVDSAFLNNIFINIADAIREKTGKNDLINIFDMPEEIRSISGVIVEPDVILPSEYQQVEYIRSTGVQYIKTGLAPYSYEVKTKIENNDGSAGQHGSLHLISGEEYQRSHCGSYDNMNLNINDFIIMENDKNIHIYKSEGHHVYFDGTHVGIDEVEHCSLQFYLCARNFDNKVGNQIIGNIYYFKAWNQANELVGHFIPCYRKPDNVIGMYDFVTNKLFTNSGTGVFSKGENIEN